MARPGVNSADRKAKKSQKESEGVDQVKQLLKYGAIGVVGLSVLLGLVGLAKSPSEPAKAAPSAVTVLAGDSFADFIAKNHEGALVDFYTPNCPHCVKLAPEFEKAAQEAKQKEHSVAFASVDCSTSPEVCKKFNIDRHPSLFWFKNGENVLELGGHTRTQQKLGEYVEWAMQPSLTELEKVSELEEALPTLRSSAGILKVIVGFEGHAGLFKALEGTAERLRGKAAFLFVKEIAADSVKLRVYGKDPAADQEYADEVTPEGVLAWVKGMTERKKPEKKKPEKKEPEKKEPEEKEPEKKE